MSDLWISVAITVIKGFVFLYDVVTYIPRYIIEQPYKKLALSGRVRVSTSRDVYFYNTCRCLLSCLSLFNIHSYLVESKGR